ncbi:MAG: Peroxisome biosynthesis protein pex1 [Chrysothrix sp. TS-e1954]|nr:MAG: Peroxisome biosynthesis protein pex1 [Chrysothrix sp. TS-e1954]
MAPPKRRAGPSPSPAELSLRELKTCLVNLPPQMVAMLLDNQVVVQNVIVEVTWEQVIIQRGSEKRETRERSVFVGWSGMQSKQKPSSSSSTTASVEIDGTFAKTLGLTEGQKIGILLHRDPPEAHTVNVEPLTPADWEIIELHAQYLEVHFMSQIRALPNPSFKGAPGHPLTLHLTPTSTASVKVTGLKPLPLATAPFAKIAKNSEVIVAPMTRQRTQQANDDDTKSVASIGGRTAGGRSKTGKGETQTKPHVFLRSVDRRIAKDYFDEGAELESDEGLRIWVDWSIIASQEFRSVSWVWVSVIRPMGLQNDVEEKQESMKPASRVIAQLLPWDDAPDSQHASLSSLLCAVLDAHDTVGDVVRVEAAPPRAARSAVRSAKVYPFAASSDRQKEGLKFGGATKADRQEAVQQLLTLYGTTEIGNKLLDGPITDGMILPAAGDESDIPWQGGIIKLHPPPGPPLDASKTTRGWILGKDRKIMHGVPNDSPKSSDNDRRLILELTAESAMTTLPSTRWNNGERLPSNPAELVGIDALTRKLTSQLRHGSSTLLTGGLGSGKTSLALLIGHRLRQNQLYNVNFFPCRTFVNTEVRISRIRDVIGRVFAQASWSARLGGHALVILDDLDVLCPVETELEVGNDNTRNRHASETVMAIVRQHCSIDAGVTLLATAQNKEAVNNVIIGGHVVREITHLPAPDKDVRRQVLEHLVEQNGQASRPQLNGYSSVRGDDDNPHRPLDSAPHHPTASFSVDPSIDFLEIAGLTDGYMPGDLSFVVSRARSEALIRTISSSSQNNNVELRYADFTAALKGFTPSSLRNVTLQHSTTSFSSIGGLRSTRQTLLETLQYPTLYAPIFAKCPLRLRSGLLLYGFPGCGKTLLASAVAGECGLNSISVKGPEILNKYIGASEKSVRDLFERAQAARPCVLFFDEFDSVAPKRGHDSTGVTDRVVNQLLTQMDGAEGLSGVYVLAATSRPDLIDPALLRPGRLDKSLLCDMPDFEDRLDILHAIGSKLKVDADLLSNKQSRSFEEVAQRTDGYTGADLQAVVYNAHLEAIHDILGDRNVSHGPNGTHGTSNTANPSSLDFTYFRLGDDSRINGDGPTSAAYQATERAQIAHQLLAQKKTKERAKALRRGSTAGQSHNRTKRSDEEGRDEPVIQWRHVERALSQTKPSIGREDVRRLTKIYREFVVGRSGEMPSGQGGSEIGGRSSLV